MSRLIEELKVVLTKELEEYKQVLELADKKTDILISGSIDKIENITKEEYEIIYRIEALESDRETIVSDIEKGFNIQEQMDLTTLIGYFNEQEQETLNTIKDELTDILAELKDKNELNKTLIDDSLQYIDLGVNLLTASSSQGTYKGDTGEINTQNKNLFDIKA
ncbi:flagella synthesis protein FlgN [Gottschalkia purinilytica]|uniref:Flagella synthesis protein FlgN n=1 Tax=Gottschalkia purinilytica TaxID=1503 RepID=A0A0L0WDV8_GOTPU|nr:flagellar protein FlgN [Gottschalkia purinilytica]KNF09659.1 flagella synthesis protein FlgN [Gottschalkia purinilytica]